MKGSYRLGAESGFRKNITTNLIGIIFFVSAIMAGILMVEEMATIDAGIKEKFYSGAVFHHVYLFASLAVMAFSGGGIVIILYLKTRSLARAFQEKQALMDLLQPRMMAVDVARDGIGIVDHEGFIQYMNASLFKSYGFDGPEDIVGKPWTMLFPPGEKKWLEEESFPVMRRKGYWQGQCEGLKKDGAVFPQDITMTQTAGGGWIWSVRDYSELAEATMISARRLAAIEAAGDGIGIVDTEGCLTYINRALMNLHGITPDKLPLYIGQPWENLYNEKGRSNIHDNVMPHVRKFGRWKGEAPLQRLDGAIVWAEMSLTLLPDGGIIGTARDVTQRYKMEKEKQELQSQFFQAQKMEAIGRLAGGVAHDFNNILASIMGYAEFLMEDLDEKSKQHHFTRQIMHGAVQARNLVEQILTFSRRKQSIHTPLDLTSAVNDTVAMLKATMPPTILLDTQIDPESAIISADPTQISQIFMNLCVNALDAMETKHGTLRIHVQELLRGANSDMACAADDNLPEVNYAPAASFIPGMEPAGAEEETVLTMGRIARDRPYVVVSISDTGIGMSREVMERMFEPFFTTKGMDKGTGLGLSVVIGMVAAHQGAMLVKSQPGKGSVFILYFPEAEKEKARKEDEKAIASAAPLIRGSGRILVVDDQRNVRDVMMEMLGRLGYEAESCASGGEAIDRLREKPGVYDLVLSDYLMPHITGIEMATEIRTDFPMIPIVLISGHAHSELETAMQDNPSIKAVLKKPADSETLGRTLQNALKGHKSAA